nr:Exportin-4 [Polyrhizophydium stewartii]
MAHYEEAAENLHPSDAAARNYQQQKQIRQASEQFLSDFRRLPNLLPACLYILERSQRAHAQFQAAVALQDSLARIYSVQSTEERQGLRQFLLSFLMQRSSTLANFVISSLSRTTALSIKLGYLRDPETTKDQLITLVVQLHRHNDPAQRLLGASLAISLLNEFSSSKATAVGLPWDFHRDCQLAFERAHLRILFEAVISAIHTDLHNRTALATPEGIKILRSNLASAERILSWAPIPPNSMSFGPGRRHVQASASGHMDDEPSDAPCFPASWRNVLLAPNVTDLFFEIFLTFQEPEIVQRAGKCIVQMAGLHGEVFSGDQDRKVYASHFMGNADKLIVYLAQHLISQPDHEVSEQHLDAAQIVRQLLRNFKTSLLVALPTFRPLLRDVGQFTVICLQRMADEMDETSCADAVEELLSMWSSLIFELEFLTEEEQRSLAAHADASLVSETVAFLRSVTFEIFRIYVEVRLEIAKKNIESEDDTDVENHFKDQCYQTMHPGNQLAVALLNEQIHWLTLISGHVLADSAEGEKPLIPSALQNLEHPTLENHPCIALPTCIFNILDLVTVEPESPQQEITSPLVVETLLWFVERWGCTYLFMDPADYSIVTSGGAPQALDFLLERIQRNFRVWHADSDIVTQIVSVLDGLSDSRHARNALLQSPKFTTVVQYFLNHLDKFPASLHSDLIQTIAYIVTHSTGSEREMYFNNVADAIEKMLVSTLHRPDFARLYQSTLIREQVITVMELYNGLALAADESNMRIIFETCARQFPSFSRLLDLYHNFPDVEYYVLQFFRDLVKYQTLEVLEEHHHDILHKTVLELIRVFAKNEVGRKRSHTRSSEDEELNMDLGLLLEILAGLITSEYEGLARDDVVTRLRKSAVNSTIDVAQVVFFGVNTLMPLINEEMLSYPRLCSNYISLVSNLIEYFPNKLAQLPPTLLMSLVSSLIYGVNQANANLGNAALAAMESLALYHWAERIQQQTTGQVPADTNGTAGVAGAAAQDGPLAHPIDWLLQQLLTSVLFKPFDSNLVPAASDTVFALAIARHQTFQSIIHATIQHQPPSLRPRLTDFFGRLLPLISAHEGVQRSRLLSGALQIGFGGGNIRAANTAGMGGAARELHALRDTISKFLTDVRGLLLVK